MNIKKYIINMLPDSIVLKHMYKTRMGKILDLKNPQLFNEKLQWLKLHDRKPIYTRMVDKYESKIIVSELIGADYIIPTIGVYERYDDIPISELPNQFVIKTTHDSGGVCICTDKDNFDFEQAKQKIDQSLKNNYYYSGREWPYKNVKPRILVEKYMEHNDGSTIQDFKLQCFYGVVDNIMVCVDRFSSDGVKYHYFDKGWNYLPYCPYEGIDESNVNISKPLNLEKMIELAEIVSSGIPELRVDLYDIDGNIFFGELTFFTASGFDTTITHEADQIMGKKLHLPKKKEMFW